MLVGSGRSAQSFPVCGGCGLLSDSGSSTHPWKVLRSGQLASLSTPPRTEEIEAQREEGRV